MTLGSHRSNTNARRSSHNRWYDTLHIHATPSPANVNVSVLVAPGVVGGAVVVAERYGVTHDRMRRDQNGGRL